MKQSATNEGWHPTISGFSTTPQLCPSDCQLWKTNSLEFGQDRPSHWTLSVNKNCDSINLKSKLECLLPFFIILLEILFFLFNVYACISFLTKWGLWNFPEFAHYFSPLNWKYKGYLLHFWFLQNKSLSNPKWLPCLLSGDDQQKRPLVTILCSKPTTNYTSCQHQFWYLISRQFIILIPRPTIIE